MKKILIALMVALFATGAHATIARLTALGMDELDSEGSYYIKDSRNIFLNVASINDYADTVMYEWGGNGASTLNAGLATVTTMNSRSNIDADAAPKARGGFLLKNGDAVYGVFLGNDSQVSSMLRILSSSVAAVDGRAGNNKSAYTLATADESIDVFYGSKTGDMKWGVNLAYTGSKNEVSKATSSENYDQKAMAVRLGVITDQWDAHLTMGLMGESSSTTRAADIGAAYTGADFEHKFDGSLGYHIGGSYKVSETGRAFAYYKGIKWDAIDGADYTKYSTATCTGSNLSSVAKVNCSSGKNGKSEGEFGSIVLGYGYQKNYGKTDLFGKIYFQNDKIEQKANQTAKVNQAKIPLTVGFEHTATEWLTLRGSVTQVVYGTRKNDKYEELNAFAQLLAVSVYGADTGGKKVSMPNTTDVRAGASLNFGDLVFDGYIGMRSNTGAKATEDGTLRSDSLLTRVGMTYKF